jgi:hypothetical protein
MSVHVSQRDLEDRMRQLSWPAPSAELRERVLATAVVGQQVTWSDRLWFSRNWRLAAVGIALACVVVDQLASWPGGTSLGTGSSVIATSSALSTRDQTIALLLEELTRPGG